MITIHEILTSIKQLPNWQSTNTLLQSLTQLWRQSCPDSNEGNQFTKKESLAKIQGERFKIKISQCFDLQTINYLISFFQAYDQCTEILSSYYNLIEKSHIQLGNSKNEARISAGKQEQNEPTLIGQDETLSTLQQLTSTCSPEDIQELMEKIDVMMLVSGTGANSQAASTFYAALDFHKQHLSIPQSDKKNVLQSVELLNQSALENETFFAHEKENLEDTLGFCKIWLNESVQSDLALNATSLLSEDFLSQQEKGHLDKFRASVMQELKNCKDGNFKKETAEIIKDVDLILQDFHLLKTTYQQLEDEEDSDAQKAQEERVQKHLPLFFDKIKAFEEKHKEAHSAGKEVFICACALIGCLGGVIIGGVLGYLAGAALGAAIGGGMGSVIPGLGNIAGALGGAISAGSVTGVLAALKLGGIGALIGASIGAALLGVKGCVSYAHASRASLFSQHQTSERHALQLTKKLKHNVKEESDQHFEKKYGI